MGSPRLAVVFGDRSPSTFELFEGVRPVAEVIWLIDADDSVATAARRFLERTGIVVDALGAPDDVAAAALAAHRPDGIVSFYDANVVKLAGIAARLGLPFHALETARALEDKLAQRHALAAAGIPSPPVAVLPAEDMWELTALAEAFTYPAVIKPRAASGSWRTERIDSPAELVSAWTALRDEQGRVPRDAPDDFIVEGFLSDGADLPGGFEANYVSVETLAAAGAYRHLGITGRLPLLPPFRESGFFLPATLDDEASAEVLDRAGAALAGIGFGIGVAHTELKLTAEGWRVIEVNGRVGGGVPDMMRIAAGLELITLAAQIALGRLDLDADVDPTFTQIGYRLFVQPPAGRLRLRSLEGLAGVKAIPGVASVLAHHQPGAVLDSRDGSRTFLAAVVGAARDHAEVQAVEARIRAELRIDYEELAPFAP